MDIPNEVAGYRRWESSGIDLPWPVYAAGSGPPVVVMHELFGLTPEVLEFADRVRGAGFTVYLPVFAGPIPSDTGLRRKAAALRCCISREINLFATKTSAVVTPVRALANAVADPHVGVVGMCMSGGFAIAAATASSVRAAVAAEPSLPVVTPFTRGCATQFGLSPNDEHAVQVRVAADDVELYITRFSQDRMSPSARLDAINRRLGPTGIVSDVIASGPDTPFSAKAHSVLAIEPAMHATPGPAHDRLDQTASQVIAFLSSRLTA
jgi:dienelactone hydrolase